MPCDVIVAITNGYTFQSRTLIEPKHRGQTLQLGKETLHALPASVDELQEPEITVTDRYDVSRTYYVPRSVRAVDYAEQRRTYLPVRLLYDL